MLSHNFQDQVKFILTFVLNETLKRKYNILVLKIDGKFNFGPSNI